MNNANILLDLYQCPSEPSRWQFALDNLCGALGVRSAVVQRFRRSPTHLQQLWTVRDSFSNAHARMHDHYVNNAENPRYDIRLINPQMHNRIMRDKDRFPSLNTAEIEGFRHRLGEAKLGDSIGAIHKISDNEVIAIIVHRDANDSRRLAVKEEQLLLNLLPHIAQASELSWQFSQSNARLAQMQSIADQLRVGIIQLDGDQRIEWANSSALDFLVRSPNLMIVEDVMRGTSPQDRRKLAAILSPDADSGNGVVIFGNGHAEELQLMRLPSAGRDDKMTLIVTAPRRVPIAPIETIANILQITLAEARVSEAVLSGSTVKAYAESRGLSEGSVRNQLKQVFAKTGFARQSDLVSYLSKSVTHQVALGTKPRRLDG